MKTRSAVPLIPLPDDGESNPLALLLDACSTVEARDNTGPPYSATTSTSGAARIARPGSRPGSMGRAKRTKAPTGELDVPAAKRSKGRGASLPVAGSSSSHIDTEAVQAAALRAARKESNGVAAAAAAAHAAAATANAQQSMTSADFVAHTNFEAYINLSNDTFAAPANLASLPFPPDFSYPATPSPSSSHTRTPTGSTYAAYEEDERRYPCTEAGCPLLFIRLEHARRHSEVCGKSLVETKHIPCPVCGTLFTREDNMKTHAKLKHKVEFPPKRPRRMDEYA